MHVPPLFAEDRPEEILAIMGRAKLCQFITATQSGLIATPIPMFFKQEGELGALYGHLARPNPQWKEPVLGEGLAILMGLDAYVTPSWYASKKEQGKVVPTWNYEAVQAFGAVEFFDDPGRLLEVVTALTDINEKNRADRWQVSDAPAAYIESQLKGIVGVKLSISRLIGKRKLSQNRSLADRVGVAKGLAQEDAESSRQMAPIIPVEEQP
jgi:transcriptional regulator